MDPSISLAQKVNDQIGEELLRVRLVEPEMVEQAKARMAGHFEKGEIKNACLLKILIWDLKLVEEKKVLDHQIEEYNLGYCNITNYEIDRNELPEFKLRECWASMSLPFDFLAEVFFVATAHYLSKEVISHWEKRLCRDIAWFVADLSSLTLTLENLEREEQEQVEEQGSGGARDEKHIEQKVDENKKEELKEEDRKKVEA